MAGPQLGADRLESSGVDIGGRYSRASPAQRSAIARPMPPAPPVTIAVRPASFTTVSRNCQMN